MRLDRGLLAATLTAVLLTRADTSLAQVQPAALKPLTMTSDSGSRVFRRELSGRFNGKPVRYTAELAETIIRDDAEQHIASVFSCSYIVSKGAANRPVIFAFNGGPGFSSSFHELQGRHHTLTTIGNSEYIMAQPDLPSDRYLQVYYDGGHMLVAQPEVMSAIRAFVNPGRRELNSNLKT